MKLKIIAPIFAALAFGLFACGDGSEFRAANTHAATASNDNQTKKTNDDPNDDENANPKDIDQGQAPCWERPQNILILDFKSGWWAGDGGDFLKTIIEELSIVCNSDLKIEYHHITVIPDITIPGGPGIPKRATANDLLNNSFDVRNGMQRFPNHAGWEFMSSIFGVGAFLETDWSKYTQIWFLSGSQADAADIKTTHDFFKKILQAIKGSGAGLLVGAGYGSITHSNALFTELGIPATFKTDNVEGRILGFGTNLTINSYLEKGKNFNDHELFGSDLAKIADNITMQGVSATGDYLVNCTSCDMLAKNTEGKDSIAITHFGEKNVVIDGGLQRYYTINNKKSPETLTFLTHIFAYLGF